MCACFILGGRGVSSGSSLTQTKLDLSPKWRHNIMQGTVDFIAEDMRPVSMVESKGFTNVIKIL